MQDVERKESQSVVENTSTVIVTYDHADCIRPCLDSVLEERPGEILVVDSGSDDGTRAVIESEYPGVRLIEMEANEGFGSANNVGARHADGEYLLFLNPDAVLETGSIRKVVEPLTESTGLVTTPKVLTRDGSRINTCGNVEHFTGLGFTRGWNEPPESFTAREAVSGISGACFAIRSDLYRALGGFDEDIFLYMEDVELSWRCGAQGIDIELVPSAVVRHEFDGVEVPPEKLYHLEKGRYIVLRKYYTPRMAVLALPSLLTTELLTLGYAATIGLDGIESKARAVYAGLTETVTSRDPSAAEILRKLDPEIPGDQLTYGRLDRTMKACANVVYRLNYQLLLS